MSRAALLAPLLAALFSAALGCSQAATDLVAVAGEDLAVEVRDFPERVVFGAPFEFELVRMCAAPLELEPFDAARLAPLLVRTLSVERSHVDGRAVERRRLLAHALVLGDTPLPDVRFLARFGARAEEALLVWPPLFVESSLAADDDGRAQVPLAPLGPARSVLPPLGVALLLVALLTRGWFVWRRRTRAPAVLAAAPVAVVENGAPFDSWLAELHAAAGRADPELYGAIVASLRRVAGLRLTRDLSSATARELVVLFDDVRIAGTCERSERACFGRATIERTARANDIDVAVRLVEEARERAQRTEGTAR